MIHTVITIGGVICQAYIFTAIAYTGKRFRSFAREIFGPLSKAMEQTKFDAIHHWLNQAAIENNTGQNQFNPLNWYRYWNYKPKPFVEVVDAETKV